jgi:phospholipid-binding lipoprotein MlaA
VLTKTFVHGVRLASVLFLSGLCGAAIAAGTGGKADPWQGVNRRIYNFNDTLDRNIIKPVARTYSEYTPKPVKKGITNLFSNANDPFVSVNGLLQGKFKQAGSDLGRFLVNSTVGIGGLVDWASGWGMPKHQEDFGQTLGYWGVGQGPYMVLPILGASTLRDTAGYVVDMAANPVFYVAPAAATIPSGSVNAVDTRANLLKSENVVREAALDRYQFIREAYLQRRESLVNDGNTAFADSDDKP